jgi:hypothetical protein
LHFLVISTDDFEHRSARVFEMRANAVTPAAVAHCQPRQATHDLFGAEVIAGKVQGAVPAVQATSETAASCSKARRNVLARAGLVLMVCSLSKGSD